MFKRAVETGNQTQDRKVEGAQITDPTTTEKDQNDRKKLVGKLTRTFNLLKSEESEIEPKEKTFAHKNMSEM